MDILGKIQELIELVFKKDTFSVTVKPNSGTYTADSTVELPPKLDGSDVLLAENTTATIKNKKLDDDSVQFVDTADETKQLDVSLGGATTATKTTIEASQTANRTLSLPDADDTLVGKATTDDLTNKTIDADTNTISNLEVDNLKAGVLDVDISTVSESDDTIPSAKATKAYADSVIGGVQTNLDNHINDTDDAHDGSAISYDNTTSGLVATDAQSAIDEVEGRVDANETAIGLNTTHRGQTDNPHSVTKTQVGLDQVDNTSDADKPISTATQTALDLKADQTEVDLNSTHRTTVTGNPHNVLHSELSDKGTNDHAAIDTAITNSANHIAATSAHGATGDLFGLGDNPTFTSTGGIKLPAGTEAQRPTPTAGHIRYNSEAGTFEGYTDKWGSLGGGGLTPTNITYAHATQLEIGKSYTVDMSGASSEPTFTLPAGAEEAALEICRNGTTAYEIQITPSGTDKIKTPDGTLIGSGETETVGSFGANAQKITLEWDNTNSWWVLTTYVPEANGNWNGSLTVQQDLTVNGNAAINGELDVATISQGLSGSTGINFGDDSTTTEYYTIQVKSSLDGSGGLQFYPRDEAGAISNYGSINYSDNDQGLILGTSAKKDAVRVSNPNSNVFIESQAAACLYLKRTDRTSGTGQIQIFQDGDGTACGIITIDATANTTSYGTSSDQRLKIDKGDWVALDIIDQLQPRKYERISDPDKVEYGFFAQELKDVVPQAAEVGGEDPDKNPWTVDYSKLVGVLTKAIQEQQDQINAMKVEIETLKNK